MDRSEFLDRLATFLDVAACRDKTPSSGDNGGRHSDTKCAPQPAVAQLGSHPMLGRRCIIRTFSAGVHIGDVDYIKPDNSAEVYLKNSIRLWRWTGGGLSLSAIANNGIKGGRLNRTGEVYLTNAIEYIPTTLEAEKTFEQFVEN